KMRLVSISFLVITIASGCQSKLNVNRAVQLDPDRDSLITIDAPRYEQTVTVTISSDVPVDFFACVERDKESLERTLAEGGKPANLLASKEQLQSESVEFKIPAQQGAVLLFRCRKAGTATLQIKGT